MLLEFLLLHIFFVKYFSRPIMAHVFSVFYGFSHGVYNVIFSLFLSDIKEFMKLEKLEGKMRKTWEIFNEKFRKL